MKRVPDSTVRRLSLYLGFLDELEHSGSPTVSSDVLARLGGTTSAQVRKDLSIFGSFGKRGLGYSVQELTVSLRSILGLQREWRVCVVGAGKIGLALAQYPGFGAKGFHVVAVYDVAPSKIGTRWGELIVQDVRGLARDAEQDGFDIGVIAVPAEAAQSVADQLAEAGVKAIMNFAPAQITTPPDVVTRTVNMGLEFEALSFALANRSK
ncbi:MAG: redox-sensing transcriptional repressor Rex [Gemmatimonadaceae bacterium]